MNFASFYFLTTAVYSINLWLFFILLTFLSLNDITFQYLAWFIFSLAFFLTFVIIDLIFKKEIKNNYIFSIIIIGICLTRYYPNIDCYNDKLCQGIVNGFIIGQFHSVFAIAIIPFVICYFRNFLHDRFKIANGLMLIILIFLIEYLLNYSIIIDNYNYQTNLIVNCVLYLISIVAFILVKRNAIYEKLNHRVKFSDHAVIKFFQYFLTMIGIPIFLLFLIFS